MQFAVHTPQSAPAGSREALAKIQEKYGFVPNLAGVIAESPGALNALLGALSSFDAPEMTLSALERQVVLLAVSVKNRCDYCAAAHSMLASMNGLDDHQLQKLQRGETLDDSRLEALRQLAEALVERRGWLPEGAVSNFLAAGFDKAQVLEVILGVSLKTLTNYVNHVTRPPVNEQFAAYLPEWAAAA